MMMIPTYGYIIAIYTHAGIGLKGTKKPKGPTKDVVDEFSPIKEFFAPKNKNSIDNDKPDLRFLVNLQPIVAIDKKGTASLTFYNGDAIGEMLVIVEVISIDGKIGYE